MMRCGALISSGRVDHIHSTAAAAAGTRMAQIAARVMQP